MTPERINDDDLLNNAKEALADLDVREAVLVESIGAATVELDSIRKVQKMLRGSRVGRPRGSRNRPREVIAEEAAVGVPDTMPAHADLDAAS